MFKRSWYKIDLTYKVKYIQDKAIEEIVCFVKHQQYII
jgi:hypothetical protein